MFPTLVEYLHEVRREYLQKNSFKAGFFPFLSLIHAQACSEIRTKTPAEVQKELSWSAEGLVPLSCFDGDCGNTLLQNITFSCICFKLLMLIHKAGCPPVRVQAPEPCEQAVQWNLNTGQNWVM